MKRSKRKTLKTQNTNKSFSGEQSPYWNFLSTHTAPSTDENGELQEPSEANPDVLPESANIFQREMTDAAQFRLDIVKEGMQLLSEQQRRIVYYCGIKGLSLDQVAKKLGIQKGTAQKLLERARVKMEKLVVLREAQLGIVSEGIQSSRRKYESH